MAAAARNSTAASRSATASMLLRATRAKPRSFAHVARGRAAKPVPASAPAPSGSSSARARQSREAAAVARQHLVVGEQVVREQHGLGALQVRVAGQDGVARGGARPSPGRAGAGRGRRRIAAHSARSQRRRSSATWSLRLRPVWSLPPTGPISSVRRRSIAMWMSSSAGRKRNRPASSSREHAHEAARRAAGLRRGVSSCARTSAFTWARLPAMSCG